MRPASSRPRISASSCSPPTRASFRTARRARKRSEVDCSPMSTEADRRTSSVEIPKGVTFTVDGKILRAKGPLGTSQRPFPSDVLELKIAKGTATLTLLLAPGRKASQALLGTWTAHVRNLASGLTLGVEAKLKVVAAHFPMKVQVRGEELVIDNFLGEKFPRTTQLLPGTK